MLHSKGHSVKYIHIEICRRLSEEKISISHHINIHKKGCGHCTFLSRITIPKQVQVRFHTKLQY